MTSDGSLVLRVPVRSTPQPRGMGWPLRWQTSTLPTGTVVVAMSSWKLSPPLAGQKHAMGFVPPARTFARVGTMKGLVFVKEKPMSRSRKASSVQKPAMPKWLLLWHTTMPMPVLRAFLTQSSMANLETTAPRPFLPSTFAVPGVSEAMRGRAAPSMRPSRSSPQYISARLTPCEGTPRRSAATSTSATSAACAGEAPAFTRHAATTA
mmetsp:Transcript_33941/g.107847  ORF Transcript_33941/g.107847 Transcript_33941/m.107847 type:complete len:208 (-) Transcript_33941:157-780(-)